MSAEVILPSSSMSAKGVKNPAAFVPPDSIYLIYVRTSAESTVPSAFTSPFTGGPVSVLVSTLLPVQLYAALPPAISYAPEAPAGATAATDAVTLQP